MTPGAKIIRFAKSIPAGLGGAGWLGLFAAAAVAQAAMTPAGLPLYFEAGRGPADSPAQFIAHGRDSQFLIEPAGAQIVLRKPAGGSATLQMRFAGANARAQLRGDAG